MSVSVSTTNKPLNPRAQDLSPKGYNRAALYSGKALDFDGVNDNVAVPNLSILSTSDFTICYAAKFEQSGDNWAVSQGTTGTNNAIITGRQAGNVIRFAFFGNDLDAPANDTPPINEWCWLAFTYNRTTKERKIYINGVLSIEDISAANPNPIGSDFQVSSYSGVGGYYNNQVSNVKAFNTALTAAQVADLYLNPEKIVPDGVASSALKLWLPMMEGAGTTAYDGSGNGNHGTISGATWVSGIGAPVAQTALVSWNKGTNLMQYSEQFDNAAWTKFGSTIRANATTSPDGYASADKVVEDTSTGSHGTYASAGVTNGVSCTWSAFFKEGERSKIRLIAQTATTPNIIYDLSNGTVENVAAGVTASVEAYANGWYRCIATTTASGTTAYFNWQMIDGSDQVAYTGDGTSGVFVWGASITQSSSVQPYIPTLATTQTSPVLLPQGLTANKDITGVNAFESARNPYALNLDGASWGEVHDNASFDLTNLTLEAWVNVKSGEAIKGILGQWSSSQGYMIYLATDSDIRIYINNEYARFDSLTTGWHHIAAVYDDDANKKYIYVDGVERENNAQTTNPTLISAPIEIGRYDESTARQYNGPIALPRIYNRALTATEVARNYNADKSKFGL